jgi:hypothetical protein
LKRLSNNRLSTGGYANAEDVLRRGLEAKDAEKSWTDDERRALSAHIEEGYQQAERAELIDGALARREIQAMKEDWRLSKRLAHRFSRLLPMRIFLTSGLTSQTSARTPPPA